MSTTDPLVSIVMAAYNAEAFVASAINSIINQKYARWELLICDDGSSDGTASILRNFTDSRIRIFHSTINHGYLETCNFIFRQALGEFITWQDADDISHADRILKQVEYLRGNPKVAMCGTWAKYFHRNPDGSGEHVRFKRVFTRHEDILEGLGKANQFCGASVMIRSNILQEVGYYQSYFSRIGNEDYDCFYRVAEKHRVGNLDDVLYFVRITPNSVSRSIRNPMQLVSDSMVKFLARQRHTHGGLDSLTGLDASLLVEAGEKALLPYSNDPSLLWRIEANQYAYNNMQGEALLSSWFAFRKRPFKVINMKYLITCFTRYLSHFLK